MPPRTSSRSIKPTSQRTDPPVTKATENEKLRDRLLALILRNEAARKQAPR